MLLKDKFITWYFNQFQNHHMYKNMVTTREDSPWHREHNVGIHTNMVVAQYISRIGNFWTHHDLLGAFACAFHDVGKPPAEETVENKERGVYRRYTGHEKLSARMWEDFIMWNDDLLKHFELSGKDVAAIGYMIEHHLPYGIKKDHKKQAIVDTLFHYGVFEQFLCVMLSDCWGRISDDHRIKKANTEEWIDGFISFAKSGSTVREVAEDAPELTVLIGPSGCGKSTYVKDSDAEVFSWDKLRMEWYEGDYSEACKASFEDKEFEGKSRAEFMKLIHGKKNIIVDNTNLSVKRRAFFVTTAKQHGYKVNGVTFPISLDVCLSRVNDRTDQPVPPKAVRQHYMSLAAPSYGEFDQIDIILQKKQADK